MKLYFAPNSRAVRIAWLLEELGLEYELQRFALGHPDMRSDAFRRVSPMGRVPVLEDGDVTLVESGAIVEYLLIRHGNGKFRPAEDSTEFPTYLQWLHYSEGMLMPPVNNYMVETFFLPPERRSEEHAGRAKRLLGRMLGGVEHALEGKEYLTGAFSGADVMTGSAILSIRQIGIDFSEAPNCNAYADRLAARPAYHKALAL
ncbi:glutathione S-transferase family protein [Aliishimia ponticola]|uniref:Glutathione S-transferase family protein n=1 Tax=Aliishimia ponticola TaxID=2499833 RepID=A0A4S4NBK6_9RHOB|nr:glutathione S-transferase family protein [Aliishimia ponticola]THH36719.1 glutathione S-transferase family protein [Aliishimia ponticola]